MSQLLVLQNRLKVRARADKLTPHQRAAFDTIVGHWHYPGLLNLAGPAGSGKTFLGWALAYARDATFLAAPEHLEDRPPDNTTPLIIDNAPTDAYTLRRLLAALQLANIRTGLLISRQANTTLLPAITLPSPTADDIAVVLRNLNELYQYSLSPPESVNLWTVIHGTL